MVRVFILLVTSLWSLTSAEAESPNHVIMGKLTDGLDRYASVWPKMMDNDFEEYVAIVERQSLLDPQKVLMASYRVKRGDNFWKVARSRHIDIDTIVGANPYLPDLFARLNQRLLLLSQKGVLHHVEKGESLRSIVDRYNQKIPKKQKWVTEDQIRGFNKIRTLGGLKEGDVMFIPGVVPQQMGEEMRNAYALTEIFTYPLWKGGRYTSFMGLRTHPVKGVKKFHNGVDIKTPSGTRVCAARSGTVIESGWKGGYGNVVVLRHIVPNGKGTDVYETLYGHTKKVMVRAGSRVKQGQIIALSGSTGMSTGPHLHFTIWKNKKVIDPLKFLWR